MKVRVFGFIWEPADISIGDFLSYVHTGIAEDIQALSVPQPDTEDGHLLLAVTKIEELWAGVLLHFKQGQKFFESELKDGKIKVATKRIKGQTRHTEVNFFLINPQNGAGLYQHYHTATHINTFGGYCQGKYLTHLQTKGLQGYLKHKPYLNETEYAKRIEELSVVNHIEFEFTTLSANDSTLFPASDLMQRASFRGFYQIQLSDKGIAATFTNAIKETLGAFRRLNISGRNLRGETATLRLTSPSVFQEFEYKDMDVNFVLDLKEIDATISKSSYIRSLIELSQDESVKAFFHHKSRVCPTCLTGNCPNPRPFSDLRELSAFA